MVSAENRFDEDFIRDCQMMSGPIDLLTLMHLFIDSPNIEKNNFPQPYLTVSQLILSDFRRRYRS